MRIEEKQGNLVIIDFNELEAYKIAVKIEEDGLRFYNKLLEKNIFKKATDVLSFLLNEEKKHLKFFEGCLTALRQISEDSFEEDNLFKDIDYGVFSPYDGLKDLEKKIDVANKALKLGLIIEDNSIKFYSACSEKVNSSQAKNEIAKIIEEEKKHKALIQDLIDTLP